MKTLRAPSNPIKAATKKHLQVKQLKEGRGPLKTIQFKV